MRPARPIREHRHLQSCLKRAANQAAIARHKTPPVYSQVNFFDKHDELMTALRTAQRLAVELSRTLDEHPLASLLPPEPLGPEPESL